MSEPKEEKRPLDMTTEEAIDFLFPKEAVEKMKSVANPEEQRASDNDENNNGDSYTQDTR